MWQRILACVLITMVGTAGQEGPVVSVTRGVGDVFTISSPDGVCVNVSCADYETYMVEDGVCVPDNTLQRKCSVYLAPVSYSDNVTTTASISVSIADNGSLLVLNDANSIFEEALLLNHQREGQNDGGMACRVTGLDVVRGENYTRQINHTGFSINSGSFSIRVHVNRNAFPYEEMDYEGELYRMNISCEGNQNVDCVFFKLVGTTTDLTTVKFNQVIHETNSSCPLPTILPGTSAPPTISSDNGVLTTRYIIIGSALATGLLFCILIISLYVVCTCGRCHAHRKQHVLEMEGNQDL